MESYKELIVWQKSMSLVRKIYRVTGSFPTEERYGLIQQMRRSAVSVPSNIAEGWGRSSTRNYIQFLRIAKGSLYELETQYLIALDLKYAEIDGTIEDLVIEISKMLNALIKNLGTIKG